MGSSYCGSRNIFQACCEFRGMLEHAELENQDAHDRRKAMCPPTHLPPPHVIFSYSQTNKTQ